MIGEDSPRYGSGKFHKLYEWGEPLDPARCWLTRDLVRRWFLVGVGEEPMPQDEEKMEFFLDELFGDHRMMTLSDLLEHALWNGGNDA